MTAVSRTAQFAKVHKVLKKHYKPAPGTADRAVIEHLLFACCLEDAHHDAAEEAFAALVHTFFDWNEIRVTSISELAEVMACLPDPRTAANRVKRVLHAVFENTFNFDLEDLRKKNLGPTVKWLEKLDGMSAFTVAYTVQAALGGHAIPIDTGTMAALKVLDLVAEKDAAAGVVPGIERAVAKAKGMEFGSLLHELGADFSANPYSATIREILLQIEPECQNRLPKRRAKPAAPKPPEPAAAPEEKPVKRGKEPKQEADAAIEEADAGAAEAAAKGQSRKRSAAAAPQSPERSHDTLKKKPAAPDPSPAEPAALRSAPQKGRAPLDSLSKRKPR
jgi:endonuclease-3